MCAAYGMPHSTFAAWDRDDRDKAVWYEIHERERHTCGTRPDDWDPERGGDIHAYTAELRVCDGCQRLAQADRRIPEGERAYTYAVLVPKAAKGTR